MTRQRAAVGALLERTDDFRSAQQLHESLRDSGDTIGLATVYRTLQALAGQSNAAQTPKNPSLLTADANSECTLAGVWSKRPFGEAGWGTEPALDST